MVRAEEAARDVVEVKVAAADRVVEEVWAREKVWVAEAVALQVPEVNASAPTVARQPRTKWVCRAWTSNVQNAVPQW